MSKNYEAMSGQPAQSQPEWLNVRPYQNVEIQTAIELVNALADEVRALKLLCGKSHEMMVTNRSANVERYKDIQGQFDHLAGVLREMRDERQKTIEWVKADTAKRDQLHLAWMAEIEIALRALAAMKPAPQVGPKRVLKQRKAR